MAARGRPSAGIAVREPADLGAAARGAANLLILVEASGDLLQVDQGFFVEGQLLLGHLLLQGNLLR